MARRATRQLPDIAAPGNYSRCVSQTPQNPDDETSAQNTPQDNAPSSEPDYGSSAFDEPTVRIPVADSAADESAPDAYASDAYAPADSAPTEAFPTGRARVLSTETDLHDGENSTQRFPTYDELSAPRRQPAEVAAPVDEIPAYDRPVKRGTLDTGLLLIRVVLGVILFGHGLQKLTGWWGGPDVSGFQTSLEGMGFDYASQLSWAGPIAEVVIGGLLVLGLAMPVAAAAAVAVLINAWAAVQSSAPGFQFFVDQGGNPGVEFETMLLITAAGLCLTGAGKIALDGNRGWTRRPMWGSLAFLVLGIAAGVAVWVLLNGTNPFS